jgi:hypothetical protein
MVYAADLADQALSAISLKAVKSGGNIRNIHRLPSPSKASPCCRLTTTDN